MIALICDICGGKLVMQKGGIAKCQNCGLEYAPERLQEMMGVVQVDSSHLNDNYYDLAKDSYDAGNYSLAEEYCNKIIESDPAYTKAHMLKGQSVASLSTVGNQRYQEAIICFVNTINSLSDAEDRAVADKVIHRELQSYANKIVCLRMENFAVWLNRNDADGLCDDLNEYNDLLNYYSLKTQMSIDREYIFSDLSALMFRLVMAVVSDRILPDFKDNPSKQSYLSYNERVDSCTTILNKSLQYCADNRLKQQIIELMVNMIEAVIKNNTTDYYRDSWGAHHEVSRLSNEDMQRKANMIDKLMKMATK